MDGPNGVPGYLNSYTGKHVLIKISGELINPSSSDFIGFTEFIRKLVSYQVGVILVIGGGNQISKKWHELHSTPRPKGANGENFTSQALLETCVLPASLEIQYILEGLLPEAYIVPAESILCERVEHLGHVGNPLKIEHEFELGKISIVPFVGVDSENIESKFNVNADDIALSVGKELGGNIGETYFLTGTGGVLDISGKIISFMTSLRLASILEGTDSRIQADGGMRKKLLIAQEFLKVRPSLVITDISHFSQEIQSIIGSGTFIAQEDTIRTSDICSRPLFFDIYEQYVLSGKWKRRDNATLERLFGTHSMIYLEGTPLGGLSLTQTTLDGKQGHLVEVLWAAEEGCGLGKIVLEKLTQGLSPLFAFSKEETFFTKMGFTLVPGVFSESGAPLYIKE